MLEAIVVGIDIAKLSFDAAWGVTATPFKVLLSNWLYALDSFEKSGAWRCGKRSSSDSSSMLRHA